MCVFLSEPSRDASVRPPPRLSRIVNLPPVVTTVISEGTLTLLGPANRNCWGGQREVRRALTRSSDVAILLRSRLASVEQHRQVE